jgi:hypothetical protein
MPGPVSRCLPLALVVLLLAPLRAAGATPNKVFSGMVTTNALLTAIYHPDGSVTNVLGADIWLGSVLTLTAEGESHGGSFQPAVAVPLFWSAADSQTTYIWETPPLVGMAVRPLTFFMATLLQGPAQALLWVYEVEVDQDGTTSVTRGLLFLN